MYWQMGYPMAVNLTNKAKNSNAFFVNDFNNSTLQKFVSENNHASKQLTPKALASQSKLIHVREVYLGANGILNGVSKDPKTSKEVAECAKAQGCIMVDAPVSGGTLGAEAGTLTFMVGSETIDYFNLVKPYLQMMGKNIVYCGTNGNGQVAKIANNMLLGISMLGTSEAMNLGVRLGMEPKLLANILNTSSGRCWSSDTYNPCPGVLPNVPAARDYEGGFGVTLMAKDMGLAVQAANESKSTVTLAAVAHQVYNQVGSTEGFQKKDFSSVFKWLNDNAKKF
ncbi:hypothetical protein HK099_001040 [Clydaea vesicula]|uniref:3-hydroxyisobutyrate dehydrogenase n=1 Tax=Clydaea vesicula TaxID=447962 RepID=A0AAD5U6Y2_9FUNG|nr:hypothetical protein HK099_001040 [Clydaea vesicula]